ncbi:hypothetical protein L6452_16369 [Arctium lappa]|uniref:Uncharacterized protein n=1 Tax=Arctium lappa TaxID=4217 RepID=A0ACB9C0M1_ARCLA|nr:hypothetical protein L6452_16369 [Arctium lappa]
MDIDVSGWILEFLLRQTSVDDHTLDELIRVLPLPDHNLSLKKSLLLRKIESDIVKATVSEHVLELLETIHELDRKEGTVEVSETMKSAYCAVAVHCALRLLGGNITKKEKYVDVVKMIWKDRALKMEKFFDLPVAESSGMELISEELKSWMCNLKAGVWDPSSVCKNVSVMKYVKCKDVVEMVRLYVVEAKEKMGPPFLELVAEKLSDDDMKEVTGGAGKVGNEERGGEGKESSLISGLLKRRPKRAWSFEEENALWIGVKKYGKGNWKLILTMYPDVFVGRSVVDLKDKWRNMSRYESYLESKNVG